jgi:hypothetical protein
VEFEVEGWGPIWEDDGGLTAVVGEKGWRPAAGMAAVRGLEKDVP